MRQFRWVWGAHGGGWKNRIQVIFFAKDGSCPSMFIWRDKLGWQTISDDESVPLKDAMNQLRAYAGEMLAREYAGAE